MEAEDRGVAAPLVSIVVPTLNECGNVGRVLEEVKRWLPEAEVVLVDGGSTDCTVEEASEAARRLGLRLKVVAQRTPGGKPGALIDGFREASGRWIAVLDADMEFSPQDLAKMLERAGGVDIVLGYRRDARPLHRRAISWGARLLAKLLFPRWRRLKDPTTEMYVVRREAIAGCLGDIKPRIKPVLEILTKCRIASYEQVEVTQRYRTVGESKFKPKWILQYLHQVLDETGWFTPRYIAVSLVVALAAKLASPALGIFALGISILGRWALLRRYLGLPQIAASEAAATIVKDAIALMPTAWLAGAAVELILVHLLRRG